jgi:hypothetical protein
MCQIWIIFRFGLVIVFRGDESTEKLTPVIQQAVSQQAVTQQASYPREKPRYRCNLRLFGTAIDVNKKEV